MARNTGGPFQPGDRPRVVRRFGTYRKRDGRWQTTYWTVWSNGRVSGSTPTFARSRIEAMLHAWWWGKRV